MPKIPIPDENLTPEEEVEILKAMMQACKSEDERQRMLRIQNDYLRSLLPQRAYNILRATFLR